MRRAHLLTALALSLAVSPLASSPAQARGGKGKLAPEIAEKALTSLKQGTKSGDFATRAAAVEGLGHAPKKSALPLVREALADPQWGVRRATIRALLALKDRAWQKAAQDAVKAPALDAYREVLPVLAPLGVKQGVKILVAALKDPAFPKPERWAKALARKGGPWMVQTYLAFLRDRKGGPAQRAFTEALATLPLPDAIPLYKAVLGRLAPSVQQAILDHVMAAPNIREVPFLKPLLKSKDAGVAFRAAAALGLRGDPAGKALLTAQLEDGDTSAKVEEKVIALRALEPIADRSLLPMLKFITRAAVADIRLVDGALAIHAKVGNPKLAPWLEKTIRGTDLQRRAVAVKVLGRVKGKSALPLLHGLLTDGAASIRVGAAQSLGDIGAPESVEPLRRALFNEGDPKVKVAYLHALAKIRTPAVLNAVRMELSAPDEAIRRAAVQAVAAVHTPETVADLKLLLRDRSPDIRRQALVAILDLGPERYVEHFKSALGWLEPKDLSELVAKHGDAMLPHLRLALASSRPELRGEALSALKGVSRDKRVSILTELAAKGDRKDLRLLALRALVDELGPKSLDVVRALAKDHEPAVRLEALDDLGRLHDKASQALLESALDDPSEAVRVRAAAALLAL